MSAKTLIIATAALAATTVMTLPSFAAGPDTPVPGAPLKPPVTATVPLRAEILFNLLDTNHDGAIDKDEFAALSNSIFAALDTNHDGKLTQDELRSRIGAMIGRRDGRGGPAADRWGGRFDGRGPGPRMDRWGGRADDSRGPGPRMGYGGGPGPMDFSTLDTNGDGVVTPDEFAAHMPIGPGPRL